MHFLAILIAYGLERRSGFFPRLQRDQWFYRFRDACRPWLTRLRLPAIWQAFLIIAVPCVALIILEGLVADKLFGLPTLALLVTVLVYSLGRGDVEAQVERYLTSWRSGDRQGAWHTAQGFSPASKAIDSDSAEQLQHYSGEALLYRDFERWFAVVFWFALAGAWAALAYRLARVYGEDSESHPQPDLMAPFIAAVEWVPARLLALSFALVGNFSTTVVCWREQLMAGVSNARLIHSCALASLVGDETLPSAGPSRGESTEARRFESGMEIESLHLLMRRTAVAWLILLAFGVLLFD